MSNFFGCLHVFPKKSMIIVIGSVLLSLGINLFLAPHEVKGHYWHRFNTLIMYGGLKQDSYPDFPHCMVLL